jgi:uncharacterized protein (TIGR02147 family)
MINIYNYLDASLLLKDSLGELKKKNSAFSLRAWAKQLGMKSHAPLHDILNGKRKVPKKLVIPITKSLKFDGKEAKYFEALVDFQRSKSHEEKELYRDRLEKLAPGELREVDDLEAYKFITDPMHIVISELTQVKGFKCTPPWIKQNLRINQNLKDIEETLKRLKTLDIIEEKNGKTIKNPKHIYTKLEIESTAIQQYHKLCGQMAMDQISKQSIDEKEFNAIAFNIQKKNLPKIKESIREFINQLIEEYEAPSHKGDETYQLNMQLFSLSKSK